MQHSSGSTDDRKLTPEEVAGREIRRLRTARGWSQEELAERMKAYGYDWHQVMIGRIETAQRPLRLNEAVDLAALFGVSLDLLLTSVRRDLDVNKLRAEIAMAEQALGNSEKALQAAARSHAEAEHHRERADAELNAATQRSRTAAADVARLRDQLASLRDALSATGERGPA